MERKIRNLFLVGTVLLAGAAIMLANVAHTSAVTCTSNVDEAFDPDECSASTSIKYTIGIDGVLTLQDVTGLEMTATSVVAINPTSNNTDFQPLSATVLSNQKYTLSLYAPVSTALVSGSNSIPATSDVKGGTSGWGIKKKNSNGENATTYTAITTSNDSNAVFYTATKPTGNNGEKTIFDVGVGISKTQPTGTYETTLIVTAAAVE